MLVGSHGAVPRPLFDQSCPARRRIGRVGSNPLALWQLSRSYGAGRPQDSPAGRELKHTLRPRRQMKVDQLQI